MDEQLLDLGAEYWNFQLVSSQSLVRLAGLSLCLFGQNLCLHGFSTLQIIRIHAGFLPGHLLRPKTPCSFKFKTHFSTGRC